MCRTGRGGGGRGSIVRIQVLGSRPVFFTRRHGRVEREGLLVVAALLPAVPRRVESWAYFSTAYKCHTKIVDEQPCL